ncbi:MAG: hypothetical protein AB7J32_25100 [Pseudonocardia sp.]
MRGPNRRQVLAAIVLAPIVSGGIGATAGCGVLGDGAPDPLVPLATQARADAALAEAVAAAGSTGSTGSPGSPVTAQAREIATARTAHAVALEAEITRRSGAPAPAAPPGSAPAAGATPAALRAALTSAGETAVRAVLELPADRVGLVASVAACCTAHAEVLA